MKNVQTLHFDPYAAASYYGDYKLGFIPRQDNHDISRLLDMGWDNIFEVRITSFSPDAHPESQVAVNVYVKNAKLNI